jgi:signal transduction histidine kinase/DNA-binding response OmpR family regulator
MVTLPTPLYDLIEPVPICLYTTAFSVAIALFERFAVDRIVVVDDQQHPLGLLQARRVLSYLQQQNEGSILDPALLEDLPCLSETESLSAIRFEDDRARHWAVVDRDHRFLGLVDSLYLRKLAELEQQLMASETVDRAASQSLRSQWQPAKSEEATKSDPFQTEAQRRKQSFVLNQIAAQGLLRSQQATAQLTQTLQQSVAQFEANHPDATSGALTEGFPTGAYSSLALRSLMQFLERLPLPLMLQTSQGSAIAQNELWVAQFGDLVDPAWVQRDAAAVLEFTTSTVRSPLHAKPKDCAQPTDWETLNVEFPHPFCQVGTTPDSCVCICPLKSGQERVIQLVKIPLGTLGSQAEADFGQAESSDVSDIDRSFRLAAIDHPSDADVLHTDSAVPDTTHPLWLVLAQDVTEQQQLTRELAAKNADLVHLNRLKDEFLACISHELRTPLTTVLGLSSLLKDQLSGSLTERQARYAQLIHRSGRHLMAIVNDILDLTRIETGQLELTLDAVNIAAVCKRAFEQAQQVSLEEGKPETELNIPAGLPEFRLEIEPDLRTIVADELRLRQMLVHLLSNALKFTQASGKFGLSVSRWEGWVAFTVWDTGIGIPAEKQHLIFQKFQQLENPLTRRFEGAGLGLVLTQRLARLHGGDISFTSQENQGSQFTLLLPPTHPQPTLTIGSAPIPTSPANRLILVVEAVVRSIDHLSAQLTELGYRVVIARSGTEAIEKARRLQPFAILLNPLLPTLSGWDVLTLLKAEPQTRQIPVIITGTRGDRDQALRNYADGFLSLPIVQKSLQQVLRQLSRDEPALPSTDASTASLVILRLSPTRYGELRHTSDEAGIDLNTLLHRQNYRVLEADDLEQAELLAQVWKPSVVLLDGAVLDSIAYLKLLSDCTFLASLPLVTLDSETTQAANQTPGLSVFPCLAPIESGQTGTSMLLQVIQVAAGFAWRPAILAIDTLNLTTADAPESGWLQALMQYLNTAGFRGMVARSQLEAEQKLESQSADLLLLYWHQARSDETVLEKLSDLKEKAGETPILVIHSQTDSENWRRLEAIATEVVPLLSMEALLDQINQLLTN